MEKIPPKILKKGLEKMEWISVKDRLPDIKQGSIQVVIYSPKGHANQRLQGSYFYIPKKGGRGRFGWCNVTHWMPMPEPPMKDEVIEAYIKRTKSDIKCFMDGRIGFKDGHDVHGEDFFR